MTRTKLSVRAVARDVAGLFARHARILLPAGAVAVVLPLVVSVTVARALPLPFDALLNSGLDTALTALFAGIAKELVRRTHHGEREIVPPRELARALRPVILPLVLVSLAQGVLIIGGLVLLIIPGFLIMARLAVAPAVVVSEKRTVRASLQRSWELVDGSTFRVLFVLLASSAIFAVLAQVLAALLELVGVHLDEELVTAAGEVLDLPLEAIAIPVMYYALTEGEGGDDA